MSTSSPVFDYGVSNINITGTYVPTITTTGNNIIWVEPITTGWIPTTGNWELVPNWEIAPVVEPEVKPKDERLLRWLAKE